MTDAKLREGKDDFLKYAQDRLPPQVYEEVCGELWLRCGASVRKIARKAAKWKEATRRNELSKLVGRILRKEASFWNLEQPSKPPPKVVSLRDDN